MGLPAAAASSLDYSRIPLARLAWPLLVENILRISLMSVDTLMLGRFSPEAVAAMSVAAQLGVFVQLLYTMVSVGSSVLITQSLGAGRPRQASHYGVASLVLMLALSLVVSALMVVGGGLAIDLYGLDPQVARYAHQFFTVYCGLSFFMAVNIGQCSLLRSWGHVRDPMLVNVFCLVLTVGGNALCLFGPFGLPVLGVAGVAASTVASQAVACGLSAWVIHRRGLELPFRVALRLPGEIYRSILVLGILTAGENMSWCLSQIAILAMLSGMGTVALTTYGTLMAVLRYIFTPGSSIGAATQILVGYLVGARRYGEASHRVYRYFATGFVISLVLVLALQVFHRSILGLFSGDPQVVALAASALLVAVVHEPGRNLNTIVIPALKAAGDVRFAVTVCIASVWGIGVPAAWLLGVRLGLGLVGVWVAMAAEEWIRGIAMLLRWRAGAWQRMTLVSRADQSSVAAVPRLPPAGGAPARQE